MKHRYAPHVQAVLDFVARISTRIVDAKPGRRVLIIFKVAGRTLRIVVSSVLPKGEDAGFYAAKECDRVRTLCARQARAVS